VHYLTIAEVANRLSTTPKAIRARIARRQLPFRRLGGRILIPEAEFEEYMRSLSGCSAVEASAAVENARR
jgi:excisionase family DNA binding protein